MYLENQLSGRLTLFKGMNKMCAVLTVLVEGFGSYYYYYYFYYHHH
jgi:hypothetical protein